MALVGRESPKATIYLYYPSKDELFRAVVRRLVPRFNQIERMLQADSGPTEAMLRGPFLELQRQLLQTDLPRLLTVLLAEGARFPESWWNPITQEALCARPWSGTRHH